MISNILNIITEKPEVIGLSAVMAFIPVIIYMWYFLKKESEPRKIVIKTFIYGCFSVVPLMFIQYIMTQEAQYNVYDLIKENIPNIYLIHLATFMFVGLTEEYAKHWVVKVADDKDKSFRRIADGIELSIIAALGFAFIEHIVYFVQIYTQEGFSGLIVPFIFRSIFTTLAHVCFSGIYGYYYGRSHFLKSKVKKDLMVTRGLISAMVLHAIFNFVLEINLTFLIIPLLVSELGFILYEFKQSRNTEIMIPE
jgi:RsiW-degrading membrane proteinase PrsW (M82 family)